MRRIQSEVGWIKKNAEEMDIVIDSRYNDRGSDSES